MSDCNIGILKYLNPIFLSEFFYFTFKIFYFIFFILFLFKIFYFNCFYIVMSLVKYLILYKL